MNEDRFLGASTAVQVGKKRREGMIAQIVAFVVRKQAGPGSSKLLVGIRRFDDAVQLHQRRMVRA